MEETLDFKVDFKYWHNEVSYKQFDLLHRYRSQPPDLDSPIVITKRNLTKYKYDDLMDQVSKDLILRQYHDFIKTCHMMINETYYLKLLIICFGGNTFLVLVRLRINYM